MKKADRIGSAADTGHYIIGELSLGLQKLTPGFLANDLLKFPHHERIRMRTSHSTDQIVGVFDIRDPVADRLVHGIFKRPGTARDRHDLGSHQAHADNVQSLTLHILRSHINHTLKTEQSTNRGRGHPVLPRPGLGNDAGLAHPTCQNDLPKSIVDLVCSGVKQVLALEIDLKRFEAPAQSLGMI